MRYLSTPALALAFLCSIGTTFPATALSAETGRSAEKVDVQRLEGRWVRPDGGYILELSETGKEGSLKAAYSNPRPINVSVARWSRKDGKLNLFVELRDFNYPGSQYELQYDPKFDRLRGTYFQAVEQQTYVVEFIRSR